MKKKCVSKIGGQAVLEGVMMKGPQSMATAVRMSDGEIVIESKRIESGERRKKIGKIPILRGIVSFFESFVGGMKITMRAGEVYGDMSSEAPGKFETWLAKTFKVDVMNVVLFIGGLLGILLSVALFIILPQVIALGIFAGCGLLDVNMNEGVLNAFKTSTTELGFGWNMLYEVIRGVVRIIVFVAYIALVSLMKDIKRLFMYHGAEHKVISCFENGDELTVENARKMSTKHDRCGTTFMFIVMIVSMLFFTVVPVSMIFIVNSVITFFVQLLVRIALIPIVAGVSYECLKAFAKYDNLFTRICKAPGLALQRLTTKEPDDSMLEVSLAAFKEVQMLENDATYPTKTFVTYTTVEKTVGVLCKILGNDKKTEAELIVMHCVGANTKTELYDGRRLEVEIFKRCKKYAENRLTGAPLQYILGVTCFYGMEFKTDTRALIPRFDTEILAEQAIKTVNKKERPTVLDLCTGSGCIGIAVKKNCDCEVYASDISEEAITLAKENADYNGVEINFKSGSLFAPFKKDKFDIIVCNPPYIPSSDINGLDSEVKDYEPRLALDGGVDGLNFYRDICVQAKKHLKKGGYLLLEVGINQADDVVKMLDGYEVEVIKDYNNPPVDRVISACLLLEEDEWLEENDNV